MILQSETRFVITDHAVDRYIQYHAAPGASLREGRDDLNRLVKLATPLKVKTNGGQALWRVDEPAMLLVIKPDGGAIVVVTVLKHHATGVYGYGDDEDDQNGENGKSEEEAEMIAAYERIKSISQPPQTQVSESAKVQLANFVKKSEGRCTQLRNEVVNLKKVRGELKNEIQLLLSREIKAERTDVHKLKQKVSMTDAMLARQTEHAKKMSDDRDKIRKALSIAVGVLTYFGDDERVRAALDAVGGIDLGFLREEFWKK